jgi:hypothetical protein
MELEIRGVKKRRKRQTLSVSFNPHFSYCRAPILQPKTSAAYRVLCIVQVLFIDAQSPPLVNATFGSSVKL